MIYYYRPAFNVNVNVSISGYRTCVEFYRRKTTLSLVGTDRIRSPVKGIYLFPVGTRKCIILPYFTRTPGMQTRTRNALFATSSYGYKKMAFHILLIPPFFRSFTVLQGCGVSGREVVSQFEWFQHSLGRNPNLNSLRLRYG
jgi:hypothetical protein